jgi:hypothetical protein
MAPHPDGPTDTACSRGLGSRLTVRATGRPLLPWPDRQPLSEATERPPSGGLFVWACELVHTPIASAGLKASDRTLPHARKNAPAEPSSDHIPLGGFARSTGRSSLVRYCPRLPVAVGCEWVWGLSHEKIEFTSLGVGYADGPCDVCHCLCRCSFLKFAADLLRCG